MKIALRIWAALLMTGASFAAFAQEEKISNYANINGALGSSKTSVSLDYFHNWKLGKKKKFQTGIGARFTGFFGSDQYYETAPAKLTTGGSGPGNLFKEVITENIDSLLITSPQVNTLNIALNLSYNIIPDFQIGFDIDLIGFSFGSQKDGSYINGNQQSTVQGKPTSFNGLGIGDSDHGSLNSEFYARYFLNERWAVKAAFQYLFTEYTTDGEPQQFPEPNDRFRNKAGMFSLGLTRKFR